MSEDVFAKKQRIDGYEETQKKLAENPLESSFDHAVRVASLGVENLITFGGSTERNKGVQAALDDVKKRLEADGSYSKKPAVDNEDEEDADDSCDYNDDDE